MEKPPRLLDVLLAELDDVTLDVLAERLAPRVAARLSPPADDGWLTTKRAAEYLGLTPNALRQFTAARTVPFEQEVPGGKCWFKRSELDAWRRGQK